MRLTGRLEVAADKSITHRALIFSSLAKGQTTIVNPLLGEDCLSTLEIFKALGVTFERDHQNLIVKSPGVEHFTQPTAPLQANNSGTTARLLMGVLAALPFEVTLEGDASLSKRPMKRVSEPLTQMNANITLTEAHTLPAMIKGQALQPMQYVLPVASAQVKSAIMLAALFANGTTVIKEPIKSRNHTEKMFETFKLSYERQDDNIIVTGPQLPTTPGEVKVCGDISSAAFFMVAAALVKGSDICIQNVGLNETRSGIVEVMKAMNADITIKHLNDTSGEPVGDIVIKHSLGLKATTIEGDLIPRLIDEIPIIALLAAFAQGTTIIKDAEELKVKETNRIDVTVELLQSLGVNLEATLDGMIIYGDPTLTLKPARVNSHGDHRLAMMLYVARLLSEEAFEIEDLQALKISYPHFINDIQALMKE